MILRQMTGAVLMAIILAGCALETMVERVERETAESMLRTYAFDGYPDNFPEIAARLRKEADAGDVRAQGRLGELYSSVSGCRGMPSNGRNGTRGRPSAAKVFRNISSLKYISKATAWSRTTAGRLNGMAGRRPMVGKMTPYRIKTACNTNACRRKCRAL